MSRCRMWWDTAPLRGGAVPVLQPCTPKGRLAALHLAGADYTVAGDAGGLHQLSEMFSLAAHWKEAIVYLPHEGPVPSWNDREVSDLLLCHHSLALRRSAWKEMRQHLHRSRIRSLEAPPVSRDSVRWLPGRPPHRHDYADLAVEGRTLFIVASAPIFRSLATSALRLSQARAEGDHTHLFGLARHEPEGGCRDDLTLLWTGRWND